MCCALAGPVVARSAAARDLWPAPDQRPPTSPSEGTREAFQRAAALGRAGQWDEAVEVAERASLRPDVPARDPAWRINLAEALMAVGQLPEAWGRVREAVSVGRAVKRDERGPTPSLLLALYLAASIAYRAGEAQAAWAYLAEASPFDPRGALLRAWTVGEEHVALLPPGDGLFVEAMRASRAGRWAEANTALEAWRKALPSSRYRRAADELAAEIEAAATGQPRPRPPALPGAVDKAVPTHLEALLTLGTDGVVAPRLDAALRPLRPALSRCAEDEEGRWSQALRSRQAHLEAQLVFTAEGRVRSLAFFVVDEQGEHPAERDPLASPLASLAACWKNGLDGLKLGRTRAGSWARLRLLLR